MLDTLPRSGGRLQAILGASGVGGVQVAGGPAGMAPRPPDPAQVAAAVARYRAYQALREFRARLYGCLTARADAAFELVDAILCADHAVTSLAELSLVPAFRRGHGALYDALAAGRIGQEKLAALLTGTLPQLVDGDESRAWVAGHDKIDRGLLEQALAGLPAGQAAQVREACARWTRLRFAIDATPYPRPDAECSPGRGHVHHDACRCDGTRKTIPGWEYQFTAALGHLRTAWAALIDVERTTHATRTRQTIRQVRNLLRRLAAAGPDGGGAPLVICDAGYSAAALTAGLAAARCTCSSGCPPAACSTPTRSPGPARRPARQARHAGHLRRRPRPGQSRAGRVPHPARHPAVRHRPRRRLAPGASPDPRRPRLVRRLGRRPARPARHRAARPGRAPARRPHPAQDDVAVARRPAPLSCDELWRAYLARFDEEHAFRFAKGHLGLTAARVRTPDQADRWVRLVMAAAAQLLLARPLAADLRRPWEKRPDPTRPLPPGRVRRGLQTSGPAWHPRPCR